VYPSTAAGSTAAAAAALERARARASDVGNSSAPETGLWASAPAAAAAPAPADAFREPWPLFVRGAVLAACAELVELWSVGVRAANGTLRGWRTLGPDRAALEAAPAQLLRDVWPRVTPSGHTAAGQISGCRKLSQHQ
jgi:hypothetical protein